MRSLLARLFVALLVLGYGCSDDSQAPVCTTCSSPYRALTSRDDVLFNLELAYNKMNFNEVTRLLDDNFVFHFSAADVQQGYVLVSQWDRANELAATANLFGQGTVPTWVDPVSDIALNLYFTDGADNWQEVAPSDTLQYPGETWYRQRTRYFLAVVAGYVTYTTNIALWVEFTVRPVDVNGTETWRIVTWADEPTATMQVATAVVENTSWGAVKSLYASPIR